MESAKMTEKSTRTASKVVNPEDCAPTGMAVNWE